MKNILAFTLIIICTISINYAQDYNTGIGIRGGLSNGLTIKHFIESDTAIEGFISSRWKGLNITGLYEKHKNAFDVDRLNWYYGVGAHIGLYNGENASWAKDKDDHTVIGIDGILGLEYNISEIPFNISIDWKPAFNLIGHSGLWADGGALSVRYIF